MIIRACRTESVQIWKPEMIHRNEVSYGPERQASTHAVKSSDRDQEKDQRT